MGSEAQAIIRQIENLDQRKQQLRQELKHARSRQLFCCLQCNRKTQVKNIDVFALYQPWNDPDEPGKEAWIFYRYAVLCSKCGNLNFIRDNTQQGEWISNRRELFKQYIEHRERTQSLSGVTMYSHDKWKEILSKELHKHTKQTSVSLNDRISRATKRR